MEGSNTGWIWGVIVLIIVVLGGWWVLGTGGGTNETGPIKIGFMGPLTGDAAPYGEAARNVVMLATKEINDAGGVNGRQLDVVYEDDKCTGATATEAADNYLYTVCLNEFLGGTDRVGAFTLSVFEHSFNLSPVNTTCCIYFIERKLYRIAERLSIHGSIAGKWTDYTNLDRAGSVCAAPRTEDPPSAQDHNNECHDAPDPACV